MYLTFHIASLSDMFWFPWNHYQEVTHMTWWWQDIHAYNYIDIVQIRSILFKLHRNFKHICQNMHSILVRFSILQLIIYNFQVKATQPTMSGYFDTLHLLCCITCIISVIILSIYISLVMVLQKTKRVGVNVERRLFYHVHFTSYSMLRRLNNKY